jgi:transcriptional regulator with XRE-family HTH domain
MGRAPRQARHYPKRLGEKLLHIRTYLDLSQTGMLERLGAPEGLLGTSISAYERGAREPPLLILLKYAKVARVSVEVLIDDDLDLPIKLASTRKLKEAPRAANSKGTSRR